jgi:hypothetical protein
MRFAKIIFVAVMMVAFATYAFDCLAMSTPEAAMQCCETMHCSTHSHGHSQECCKTMPSMQASFVRPASVQAPSLSIAFVAVLPDFSAPQAPNSPSNVLTAQCHAPPIPKSALSPLRI